MVTREGIPKLLDFGIVKIMNLEDLEATTLTLTVQRVMTPEYASPEQARGESVTTATDVYSLGLVLYELLTGHRPFRFKTTSVQEVTRIICEEEPLKPSQAVTRKEESRDRNGKVRIVTPAEVSRTRGARPDKLKRRLSGDLDHIVLKALRKEAELRYPSVEHLSEDIQRHLKGLPVLARRGTWRYRSGKLLKRHKAAFSVVAVLLLFIAGWVYVVTRDARRSANRLAAEQVLSHLWQIGNQSYADGSERDRISDILENAQTKKQVQGLEDQPEDMLRYVDTMVQTCELNHLPQVAVYWCKVALQVRKNLFASDDREVAKARFEYGRALHRAGLFNDAERTALEAIRLCTASPQAPPDSLCKWNHLLALIHWDRGDPESPQLFFEEALNRSGGFDRESLNHHIKLITDYARYLEERGNTDRALAMLERAAEVCRDEPTDDQDPEAEEEYLLATAAIHHTQGLLLWHTPRYYESEIYLRRALEIYLHNLHENDPRVLTCNDDLAFLLLTSYKSDPESPTCYASQYWKIARWERESIFGSNSIPVGQSHFTMASAVRELDAPTMIKNALKNFAYFWPEQHPKMAELRGWEAFWHDEDFKDKALQKSESLLVDALQDHRDYYPADHWKIGQTLILLGYIRVRRGLHEQGMELILEGLRLFDGCHGRYHPHTGRLLQRVISRIPGKPELIPVKSRLQERLEECDLFWPYERSIQDCDFSPETRSYLNFEDDQAEKILIIDNVTPLDQYQSAYLWIYAQLHNYTWQENRDYDNMRLMVNLDPEQVLEFNGALKCSYITTHYQWIPIIFPVAWLKPGPNIFTLYEGSEEGYEESRPWQYNNLMVGVDTDHNYDRSWWFGGKGSETCCYELTKAAQAAKKPLKRSDPLITEHREQGYRECKGELMIILELH
jgi:tetratricopeptide (TPR) repeat protein